MSLISRQNGVPEKLAGCHTMLIGGYVVEGHVPVAPINKLLKERPKHQGHLAAGHARGLARHDRREDRAVHDLRDLRRGQGVHGGVRRAW